VSLAKKIFITGGSGRMGSVLIPLLKAAGWTVEAPSSTSVNILEPETLARFLESFQPAMVLHLAAYTDVAKAEKDQDLCWKVNVEGTRNVARVANQINARMVHISSDYVFDGERGNYLETDTPNPSNYYSLTKLVAEEASRQARDLLIVRTSFKESVWRYPMAFMDQFTSADFVDVIASELLLLLKHLELVQTEVLNLVTERKSVFELAVQRNPTLQPGSRLDAKVHIPPDVSLNIGKWQELKQSFTKLA
jgi:dTDP-4-dehydrorhamnose reductase